MKLPHNHGDEKLESMVVRGLPEKEHFKTMADIFKLLDDGNRLQIFWTLCHIEECVINLAAMLNISNPALAHHLKILKSGGIIVSRREGKEVYYKAAATEEATALHKAVEQIMAISCPKHQKEACLAENVTEELTEQERILREIHKYLSENLNKRITIEQLSHRFFINQTTLKREFKKLYGTSIAAHIKEHRMEKAASLLTKTDISVAETAKTVGYSSQSKFSNAFYETYKCLPAEYRKKK